MSDVREGTLKYCWSQPPARCGYNSLTLDLLAQFVLEVKKITTYTEADLAEVKRRVQVHVDGCLRKTWKRQQSPLSIDQRVALNTLRANTERSRRVSSLSQ